MDTAAPKRRLKKALNGWQIFFIALSAVIGTGIFGHDGLALSLAGPAGLILATGVIGVVAICFMDGLSELIQIFPCPNALVEYVHAFVDPDLGICVGVVYWFAWGKFGGSLYKQRKLPFRPAEKSPKCIDQGYGRDTVYFNLQMGAAADISSAWTLGDPESTDILLRILLFFIGCPVALYFINTRDVNLFGWLETVFGLAKLVIVSAMSLTLYYLAGLNEGLQSSVNSSLHRRDLYDGQPNIGSGFTQNADFPNPVANFFGVLPIVAFAWTGVEITAVTAYEAVSLPDLRRPSQRIVYVVFLVYIICAVGSAMAVRFDDPALARWYRDQPPKSATPLASHLESQSPVGSSSSLIVIAANQVGKYTMAQAFNGILIFSALSAGNTALYVASRTIYGLAANHNRKGKICNWLATVKSNGVPKNAVKVSALAFFWVPFISLADHSRPGARVITSASQQFLNTVSSLCVLSVWAAVCLAFVRYWHWLRPNSGKESRLRAEYPEVDRWGPRSTTRTLLKKGQPTFAYFGLIACIATIVIFPVLLLVNNPLDNSSATAYQILQIYLTPGFITVLWLSLKAIRFFSSKNTKMIWYVKIGDEEQLINAIKDLLDMSEETPNPSPSTTFDVIHESGNGANRGSKRRS